VVHDEDAERIASGVGSADRATLARWVGELLADRAWRSGLLQQEARQLAALRGRLRQASEYLEGLVVKAEETARAPWQGRQPCPQCGAAAVLVRGDLRSDGKDGHVVVHHHPDGGRCEVRPKVARPASAK
jgi:hypothetical protein